MCWISVNPLLADHGAKHQSKSRFMQYDQLLMAGYQGWFRTPGDPSGENWWIHYGKNGFFDTEHCTIDLWPDVSEYKKTYDTPFYFKNGEQVKVFSSVDKSTLNLHFQWMKDYQIDGAFMQRFYVNRYIPGTKNTMTKVLENGMQAAQKHERAWAVMYDLSGMNASNTDCQDIIDDWKYLIDSMRITRQGKKQTYLYDQGKPVVAIWGLGFKERPYDTFKIQIETLLDFLQHDPEYGGCAVMVGVPTYWRTLKNDCITEPKFLEVMKRVDVIMPWMVGRFDNHPYALERYKKIVAEDQAWCDTHQIKYVPVTYPGFSNHNLSLFERGEEDSFPVNMIKREEGLFFQQLLQANIDAKASNIYVAMFDEIDEGTAIFKCINRKPAGPLGFSTYEGMPSDTYLKIAGDYAQKLKRVKKRPSK